MQNENLNDGSLATAWQCEFPPGFILSVVIPVYEEEATLEDLVRRVTNVPIRKEIILVDDGSQDRSTEIARRIIRELNCDENQIQLMVHAQNQGKGAAITTGFKVVTGDVVIVQDADLEYDPQEYASLIKPVIEGKADVVYGSRFLGKRDGELRSYWHYVGNRLLTWLSNCFTKLNLTDMETCYKVFTKAVIDEIAPELRQQRFGIEPEITARIARRKYRVCELPISYSGRSYPEGKKIGWRDGLWAVWCIVRYGLAD